MSTPLGGLAAQRSRMAARQSFSTAAPLRQHAPAAGELRPACCARSSPLSSSASPPLAPAPADRHRAPPLLRAPRPPGPTTHASPTRARRSTCRCSPHSDRAGAHVVELTYAGAPARRRSGARWCGLRKGRHVVRRCCGCTGSGSREPATAPSSSTRRCSSRSRAWPRCWWTRSGASRTGTSSARWTRTRRPSPPRSSRCGGGSTCSRSSRGWTPASSRSSATTSEA